MVLPFLREQKNISLTVRGRFSLTWYAAVVAAIVQSNPEKIDQREKKIVVHVSIFGT